MQNYSVSCRIVEEQKRVYLKDNIFHVKLRCFVKYCTQCDKANKSYPSLVFIQVLMGTVTHSVSFEN